MQVRAAFLTFVTSLVFVAPARAADDDAIQKELKKLQGAWQVTSREISGAKDSGKDVEKFGMIIKDNKFTLTADGKDQEEGTFKLVEVKGKSRKTDIVFTKGLNGMTYNIAEWIDDNSFRTCGGSEKRPTEFTSTTANLQVIIVFNRVKK